MGFSASPEHFTVLSPFELHTSGLQGCLNWLDLQIQEHVHTQLKLREAPMRKYSSSFGHCPNSHWTPPPPPHSNGHSVAPIFGQNHANARLYMDISPKNRCHKPSWQGFRPPPPPALKRALCGTYFWAKSCKCPFVHGHFGQCPNEQRFSYVGASL